MKEIDEIYRKYTIEEINSDFIVTEYCYPLEEFLIDLKPHLLELKEAQKHRSFTKIFEISTSLVENSIRFIQELTYQDYSYEIKSRKLFSKLILDSINNVKGILDKSFDPEIDYLVLEWLFEQTKRNEYNLHDEYFSWRTFQKIFEKFLSKNVLNSQIWDFFSQNKGGKNEVVLLIHLNLLIDRKERKKILELLDLHPFFDDFHQTYLHYLMKSEEDESILKYVNKRIDLLSKEENLANIKYSYYNIMQSYSRAYSFDRKFSYYNEHLYRIERYSLLKLKVLSKLKRHDEEIKFAQSILISRSIYHDREFRFAAFELIKENSSEKYSDLIISKFICSADPTYYDKILFCVRHSKWHEIISQLLPYYNYRKDIVEIAMNMRDQDHWQNTNLNRTKVRDLLSEKYTEDIFKMYSAVIDVYLSKRHNNGNEAANEVERILKLMKDLPKDYSIDIINIIEKLILKFPLRKTLLQMLVDFRKNSLDGHNFDLRNFIDENTINLKENKQKEFKWDDEVWAQDYLKGLYAKENLYELQKELSGGINLIPESYSNDIFEIYKLLMIQKAENRNKKGRDEMIIKALNDLSDLMISPDQLFEVILYLQLRFPKRENFRKLVNKLLNKNNLRELFVSLSDGIEKKVKTYINEESQLKMAGQFNWEDEYWANNYLKELDEKQNLYELQKELSGYTVLIPKEYSNEVFEIYKKLIIRKAESKDKKERDYKISEAIRELSDLDKGVEKQVEMIILLQERYPKREKLSYFLGQLIEENALREAYSELGKPYKEKVKKSIKEISKNDNKKEFNWDDPGWVNTYLEKLQSKENLYEFRKELSEYATLIPNRYSSDIVEKYKNLILKYAKKSHKADRDDKIISALHEMSNIKIDKHLFDSFITTLMLEFPNRIRFMEKLGVFLI